MARTRNCCGWPSYPRLSVDQNFLNSLQQKSILIKFWKSTKIFKESSSRAEGIGYMGRNPKPIGSLKTAKRPFSFIKELITCIKICFCISLQPECVNLWYFKLLFDLAEFIASNQLPLIAKLIFKSCIC